MFLPLILLACFPLYAATDLNDTIFSDKHSNTQILHKTPWATWYLTDAPLQDTESYPKGTHIFVTRFENLPKNKDNNQDITGEKTILYAVEKKTQGDSFTCIEAYYAYAPAGLCFIVTKDTDGHCFPEILSLRLCTRLQAPNTQISFVSEDVETTVVTYPLPNNPAIPEDELSLRITSTKTSPFTVVTTLKGICD